MQSPRPHLSARDSTAHAVHAPSSIAPDSASSGALSNGEHPPSPQQLPLHHAPQAKAQSASDSQLLQQSTRVLDGSNGDDADMEDANDTVDDDDEQTEEDESPMGSSSRRSHHQSHACPGSEELLSVPVSVEVLPVPVHVEPPQRYHKDWQAWMAYKKTYEGETMQMLAVHETMNVSLRNARTLATKGARRLAKNGLQVPLVPESWEVFQRVYICTHAWKRKPAGNVRRPRRYSRFTACPFRFVVQVVELNGSWCLEVKHGVFHHNHRVALKSYGNQEPQTATVAQFEPTFGAKRASIFEYVIKMGENVSQSDMIHAIRSLRERSPGLDDDQAAAFLLAEFSEADDGNVVTVDESAHGCPGVMSFSSRHMRETLSRFSELLVIDCTQAITSGFHLCTFMTVSEHGTSQVVQHSLLEAHTNWHMERAVEHLKRANPDAWTRVRVIILENDKKWVCLAEKQFPSAKIAVYSLHVLKFLKWIQHKPPQGTTISQEDRDLIEHAARQMIDAESADEYRQHHESLRDVCERLRITAIDSEMERHASYRIENWVKPPPQRLPFFRSDTNAFMERFFDNLETALPIGTETMAAIIQRLISESHRATQKSRYLCDSANAPVSDELDEEMQNVSHLTTGVVTSKISHEYTAAMRKYKDVYTYSQEAGSTDALVLTPHGERRVCLRSWCCSCRFATAMKLPCRHAIAYRKMNAAYRTSIPLVAIHARWRGVTERLPHVSRMHYNVFQDSTTRQRRTSAERYRDGLRITTRIASDLMDVVDDEEFDALVETLLLGWENIRKRKRRRVTPKPDLIERCACPCTCGASAASKPKQQQPVSQTWRHTSHRQPRILSDAREIASRDTDNATLECILRTILDEKPSIEETLKRLDRIPVAFQEHDDRTPQYSRHRNPIVVANVFYLLPPKLLDACIKKLPLSNSNDDAISLCSKSVRQGDNETSRSFEVTGFQRYMTVESEVDVIFITGIGVFLRKDIEVMKALSDLKVLCTRGKAFCNWLLNAARTNDDQNEVSSRLASVVLSKFPYSRLPGFDSDYHYEMLYRLQPPHYVNDALISACCQRLEEHYASVRYAGMLTTKTRNQHHDIDSAILSRLSLFVDTEGVTTALLPVNVGNHHWCCILIDFIGSQIRYYDPAQLPHCRTVLDALSRQLVTQSLEDFEIVSVDSPVQADTYSCGVLACFQLWRTCCSDLPTDMSDAALPRRRVELLRFLLGREV